MTPFYKATRCCLPDNAALNIIEKLHEGFNFSSFFRHLAELFPGLLQGQAGAVQGTVGTANILDLARTETHSLQSLGIHALGLGFFTRNGDMLVANPNLGRIMLLAADRDRDGHSDGRKVLIEE